MPKTLRPMASSSAVVRGASPEGMRRCQRSGVCGWNSRPSAAKCACSVAARLRASSRVTPTDAASWSRSASPSTRRCTGSARIQWPSRFPAASCSSAAAGRGSRANALASQEEALRAGSRTISARPSHRSTDRRRGDGEAGERDNNSGTSRSSGIGRQLSTMPDRQNLRFCTSSDGTRLAYAGVGSGPPLMKASNWLSHIEYDWSSPIWRHWIEGLSRNRTYYRYDARGCGLSDRNPAEISFESWIRDLEAVVDAAKLDRFPLLGISQGGAIAIEYATRHPDRVSHLILYGAFARGRLKRGEGQASIDETMTMYKLFELGWGTDNRAFRQVFATQFLPDGSHELIDAFDELQRQ